MSEDLDALLKRVDPDRWLSSRFVADPALRADVVAIYAFDHELARAPKVASNPLLGEIRLTWWREALDEIFDARPVRHHPGARALAETVRRHALPRELLEAMIDARYRELDPAPMAEAEPWRGPGTPLASPPSWRSASSIPPPTLPQRGRSPPRGRWRSASLRWPYACWRNPAPASPG